MCGICGIVAFSRPPRRDVIEAMTASLAHRGPDDGRVALLGPAALGHRRLSIIDLSPTGRQPMATPDGRYTMVYNGETYDFAELRQELRAAGVTFRGTSDTEVVLEAYVRWGVDAFARLNGMFALAIWDRERQELVLARDRFGIKPLYVASAGGAFAFASEIKALIAAGVVEPRLEPRALHEFLYFGNALGPTTFFAGVEKVLPGHWLRLGAGGRQTGAFWSLARLKPPTRAPSFGEAAGEVRRLLADAVERHLVADVPVGVLLSGGIDSSAIAAFASRRHPGLETYSIGFDFAGGVQELPKARRVADQFGTRHHELQVASGNLPAVLTRLVESHDEPFADSADLPLYLVAQQLAGRLKVVLQGDGGDEVFAGYRRYNAINSLWPVRPVARMAAPLLPNHPKDDRLRRAVRLVRLMGDASPARTMALFLSAETRASAPLDILSADMRRAAAAHDPFARYEEWFARLPTDDPVQKMLWLDTALLLPDTYLEKVDKPTMAHGVEVRVPFLDATLTDYVLSLPSSLKIKGGEKKRLLRAALRGVVPDFVLDGPKTGFGVPIEHWLATSLAPFARSVLLDPASADLFDRRELERRLDEHTSGRRNHGTLLYKCLQLGMWAQRYLRTPAKAAA